MSRPTAYRLLPTAYCLLPTAYRLLPTFSLILIAPAAHCCYCCRGARVDLKSSPSRLNAGHDAKMVQDVTDLKVGGLRIRSQAADDEPKIEQSGTKDRPVFHVIGRITTRGILIVPGGQFNIDDQRRSAAGSPSFQ